MFRRAELTRLREDRKNVTIEFRDARVLDKWSALHPGENVPLPLSVIRSFECVSNGAVIGHCAGSCHTGEILSLSVLPDYQSQGIGRKLLALLVDELRSAGVARIWVEAPADRWYRAHGFYRAVGWVATGRPSADGWEILELPSQ